MQTADVFHAIAHPARRAILSKLRRGELQAGELAAPFAMTFAAVSQHLRVLEEAALVTARRDGRHRYYALRPEPLGEVSGWLEEFAAWFEGRLDALGDQLDAKHGRKR
jgi:DNA-binding transcriptional ArsR family regulator